MLTDEEASEVIRKDDKCKAILFPYLNGDDLNSRPDQTPSRYAINFFDWPLSRIDQSEWNAASQSQREQWEKNGLVPSDYGDAVAQDFAPCIDRIRTLVFPERSKSKREAYRIRWWQYAERQTALYEKLGTMTRTLATAQTTKYLAFTFVPTNIVFSNAVILVLRDDDSSFALLSSSLHESWVREYCSSLESRLRYVPTDVGVAGSVGKAYRNLRETYCRRHSLGITDCYNRFHEPYETSTDIQKLRELRVEMDNAAADAYGWSDLKLDHGFHETKQGIRYTISEPARREVLQRLLKLNHERYAEEVKQGLHGKKKGATKKSAPEKTDKPKATKKATKKATPMFDFGEDDE
jgi:hypothetical protein